jgi:hypothetical protein
MRALGSPEEEAAAAAVALLLRDLAGYVWCPDHGRQYNYARLGAICPVPAPWWRCGLPLVRLAGD